MKRIANALGKLNCGKQAYAVFALCAMTAITLPAQTLTTLHAFDGTDGYQPYAGLVQATNGDLYGTTQGGGANQCPSTNGCGTVFKITRGGTLTTIYSFCSQGGLCTDGEYPVAGLVQATNGDFYGTTPYGGANNVCPPYNDCGAGGTVFKITPSGALTTLYSFCSQVVNETCTDGQAPEAGLVQGTNGDFYGTTALGGPNGEGTVFKITPGGTLTTLYSFCSQAGCTDGARPVAGLSSRPPTGTSTGQLRITAAWAAMVGPSVGPSSESPRVAS